MERNNLNELTVTIQRRYDDVLYPSHPYPLSHPDYLATLATLFGLTPPPVNNCRVLEIGCGVGGNIIPMAESLPHSYFVGIDLSPRQITEGQKMVNALQLPNITLHHMNVMDIAEDFGTFDYIIAHGVYSWVPAEVQDKLLAVCRQCLTPQGVAYISYNTYPGWHMFGMIRDMMLYHTWHVSDSHERAAQAARLLHFLVDGIPDDHRPYRDFLLVYIDFLQQKMKQAGEQRDAFLIHDELSDINTPVYFSQFVSHAAQYGLQYITETEVPNILPENISHQVAEHISSMARNVIESEQYIDFLRGRTFRESLLCHQEVQVNRHFYPQCVRQLSVASLMRPISFDPDISSPTAEEFRSTEGGGSIVLNHPFSKAAMVYLADIAPRAVDFATLLAQVRSRLHISSGHSPQYQRDEEMLAANLLTMFRRNTKLVRFHCCPLRIATADVQYPVARRLARYQAQHQTVVTNLLHQRVQLDEMQRLLLPYLDGTHDRTVLQHILAMKQDIPYQEEDVEKYLCQFAQAALLVDE